MATAAPKCASDLTDLASRRVKPDHEAAFEHASERVTAAARPLLPRVMVVTMLVVLMTSVTAPG